MFLRMGADCHFDNDPPLNPLPASLQGGEIRQPANGEGKNTLCNLPTSLSLASQTVWGDFF